MTPSLQLHPLPPLPPPPPSPPAPLPPEEPPPAEKPSQANSTLTQSQLSSLSQPFSPSAGSFLSKLWEVGAANSLKEYLELHDSPRLDQLEFYFQETPHNLDELLRQGLEHALPTVLRRFETNSNTSCQMLRDAKGNLSVECEVQGKFF